VSADLEQINIVVRADRANPAHLIVSDTDGHELVRLRVPASEPEVEWRRIEAISCTASYERAWEKLLSQASPICTVRFVRTTDTPEARQANIASVLISCVHNEGAADD